MKKKALFKEFLDEISQVKSRNPRLRENAAFVFWFLQAYLVDSEEVSKKALTGDTSDKNVDAILLDHKGKQAYIIQGKFRESESHAEKRNDVLALADLSMLPWERKSEIEAFYSKLDPLVSDKVKELVHCVRGNKYELKLFYVTT